MAWRRSSVVFVYLTRAHWHGELNFAPFEHPVRAPLEYGTRSPSKHDFRAIPTGSIKEVATHNIVLTSAQPPALLILDDSEHHHPALDLYLTDLSLTAKVLHYYNDDVVGRMYHRQEKDKKRLNEQEKHGIHPLEICTGSRIR